MTTISSQLDRLGLGEYSSVRPALDYILNFKS